MRTGAIATFSVCCLLVGTACGGDDDDTTSADNPTATTQASADTAATAELVDAGATAVELGDEPEFTPVERLLSALDTDGNLELFLSAFDTTGAECDPTTWTWPSQPEGAEALPGLSAEIVDGNDDRASVTVTADDSPDPFMVDVRRTDTQWVIDEDVCEWWDRVNAATGNAQDSGAKSDLRNALAAAKVVYTDTEDFSAATPSSLGEIEPAITYDSVENAAQGVVGVGDATPDTVLLVTQSVTGTWFCVAEDAMNGTTFGSGAALSEVDTVAECTSGWDDEGTDA